jgi:hypothetical protein
MKSYLDNLRPLEKRLVVGIGAVLFVVLNFVFVFPHFSDWGRVKTRMDDARWTIDKFKKEIDLIPVYTNSINTLTKEGQDVPPEEQLAEFSRAINLQAGQSQVTILNLQKMTTKTNQFFLELSQGLSVQSTEERLVDFLYSLGAGNSLIRVRGLTIKPDLPRQQLGAGVTLVASYQKKAPAPAAAKSTTPASRQTAAAGKTAAASAKTATSTAK